MAAIILILVIMIGLGILLCFKGQKFYFPYIAICTFATSYLSITGSWGSSPIYKVLVAVGISAVLALLARFFYMVGMFINGAILGAGVGLILSIFMPFLFFIPVLVCAVLFGVLAVKWCKIFICISTSATGASLIAVPVVFLIYNITRLSDFAIGGFDTTIDHFTHYLQNEFKDSHIIPVFIITAIFFIIGVVYQFNHKDDSAVKDHN